METKELEERISKLLEKANEIFGQEKTSEFMKYANGTCGIRVEDNDASGEARNKALQSIVVYLEKKIAFED